MVTWFFIGFITKNIGFLRLWAYTKKAPDFAEACCEWLLAGLGRVRGQLLLDTYFEKQAQQDVELLLAIGDDFVKFAEETQEPWFAEIGECLADAYDYLLGDLSKTASAYDMEDVASDLYGIAEDLYDVADAYDDEVMCKYAEHIEKVANMFHWQPLHAAGIAFRNAKANIARKAGNAWQMGKLKARSLANDVKDNWRAAKAKAGGIGDAWHKADYKLRLATTKAPVGMAGSSAKGSPLAGAEHAHSQARMAGIDKFHEMKANGATEMQLKKHLGRLKSEQKMFDDRKNKLIGGSKSSASSSAPTSAPPTPQSVPLASQSGNIKRYPNPPMFGASLPSR